MSRKERLVQFSLDRDFIELQSCMISSRPDLHFNRHIHSMKLINIKWHASLGSIGFNCKREQTHNWKRKQEQQHGDGKLYIVIIRPRNHSVKISKRKIRKRRGKSTKSNMSLRYLENKGTTWKPGRKEALFLVSLLNSSKKSLVVNGDQRGTKGGFDCQKKWGSIYLKKGGAGGGKKGKGRGRGTQILLLDLYGGYTIYKGTQLPTTGGTSQEEENEWLGFHTDCN